MSRARQAASSRALSSGPAADALETRGVLADERLLLGGRPAFQLTLARHRACDRRELLGIDDSDGSPGRGVARTMSFVVGLFSRRKVVGVTDVERSVGAAGDVDKRHDEALRRSSGTIRLSRGLPFDSLRSLRAPFDSHVARPSTRFARSGHHSTLTWPAMSEPTARRRRAVGESNGAEERI
jgi:hypothetical protein